MHADAELRVDPAPEILEGARRWLEAVRSGAGAEFLAAYLTGSVLTRSFDPKHSHVNVLVVARELPGTVLDALARAMPPQKKRPRYDGHGARQSIQHRPRQLARHHQHVHVGVL